MRYLTMPHNKGWIVMYKEARTIPAMNGRPEYTKEVNDSRCFREKADAEKFAENIEANGATIREISECIYFTD